MNLQFLAAIAFIMSGVCASQATSTSPEPDRPEDKAVLSQQAKDFIISNFQATKSKSLKIYVDEAGNIITGDKNKEINTVVDYIQLLASDLVAAQVTNKMMLLEGFILMTMIQGDVWPVDYIHPAVKVGDNGTVNEDTKNLLINAAKIAAYAMTYRMGLDDKSDGAIQKAQFLGTFQAGKDDYNYVSRGKVDASLNRSKVRALLGLNQTPQALALQESRDILETVSPNRPRDSNNQVEALYQAMYGDSSQKKTHGGTPKGLPSLLSGQSVDAPQVDEKLGVMNLVNTKALSTASSSTLASRRSFFQSVSPVN